MIVLLWLLIVLHLYFCEVVFYWSIWAHKIFYLAGPLRIILVKNDGIVRINAHLEKRIINWINVVLVLVQSLMIVMILYDCFTNLRVNSFHLCSSILGFFEIKALSLVLIIATNCLNYRLSYNSVLSSLSIIPTAHVLWLEHCCLWFVEEFRRVLSIWYTLVLHFKGRK